MQRGLGTATAYALSRALVPERDRRTVDVYGVPGIQSCVVDGPAVVAVNGRTLRTPLLLRPPVRYQSLELPVPVPVPRQEIQRFDREGQPVFTNVDTTVYSVELTCWCGTKRYVRPNCRHEVTLCRPCTERVRRIRRRAKVRQEA